MELNDLLRKKAIAPEDVLVLRHRPYETRLNKVFPWIIANRHELFNAYQQTQNQRAENSFLKSKFIASFYGHESRKALFVGLYKIGKTSTLNFEDYWQIPENIELKKYGMDGWKEIENHRNTILKFDLELCDDFYVDWRGKLAISWPPPEISWVRKSAQNIMPILAIHAENHFVNTVSDWKKIELSWDELQLIPENWKRTLQDWCAIYFIFDSAENKGYVGSAYGEQKLLQRWMEYASTGHGGNVQLKKCDPKNFTFTILQLMPPDTDAKEVIAMESNWKRRLHTQKPYGLNEN